MRMKAFLSLSVALMIGLNSLSAVAQNTIQATDFVDVGELISGDPTEEELAIPEEFQQPAKTTVKASDLQVQDNFGIADVPLTLEEAEGLEADGQVLEKQTMEFDIRNEAIKEAAISYGARAGLSWRTYYIRREMDRRGRALDRIYNFSQLLIPAPSGLLIEPPIISENVNSMIIQADGQQAAVSDRIYNIMNNAKIVSTARTWRTYLERNWGDVTPPPDILRPQDNEERDVWVKQVRKGWKEGVKQANEIFEQDLNQLNNDFEGMIRYRMLLAQGMVSAPYALQVDRGVTGGGDEMRIGDRAIQITGKPALRTGYETWQPASR